MNKWILMALVAVVLGFTSCDNDDGFIFDPDLMHLDGANDNAPILPPGLVETAAQFDSDVLDNYSGKRIDAVQFFIYEVPSSAEFVIYSGGSGNQPGQVLYSQVVTTQLSAQTWNEIALSPAVNVPSNELWISLKINNTQPLQVIGCDAGPRVDGGDWMYEQGDGQWLSFNTRTSGEQINWNIRASIVD